MKLKETISDISLTYIFKQLLTNYYHAIFVISSGDYLFCEFLLYNKRFILSTTQSFFVGIIVKYIIS